MKPDPNSPWGMMGRYTTLAFVLPSSMFVGFVVGFLLDKLFGTTYLDMVFLLLGIVAGFVELIRELQKNHG